MSVCLNDCYVQCFTSATIILELIWLYPIKAGVALFFRRKLTPSIAWLLLPDQITSPLFSWTLPLHFISASPRICQLYGLISWQTSWKFSYIIGDRAFYVSICLFRHIYFIIWNSSTIIFDPALVSLLDLRALLDRSTSEWVCWIISKQILIIDDVDFSKHSRGGSRAAATSKMECFVITVNGFQLLTIITIHSILDMSSPRSVSA